MVTNARVAILIYKTDFENKAKLIQTSNLMKTLSLSIELSNIALETADLQLAPQDLLHRLKAVLAHHADLLGKLTATRKQQKHLGSDLRLHEYEFDYEKHSIQLQLIHFLPRGSWQVQGFRLW